MSQLINLTRGDTRTITLTLSGGGLSSAVVAFSARARAEDDDAVWAKTEGDGVTVVSDTEATASITVADWDLWEAAGEPMRMAWDWQVTVGSAVTTVADGTFVVLWDVTR